MTRSLVGEIDKGYSHVEGFRYEPRLNKQQRNLAKEETMRVQWARWKLTA